MNKLEYVELINVLNLQKNRLGISYRALASKVGATELTLKKILSGKNPTAHFKHVVSLANALGVELVPEVRMDAEKMREMQAEKKAKEIVAMVQGTSILEDQALEDEEISRLVKQTIHELLAGSSRKLWAE